MDLVEIRKKNKKKAAEKKPVAEQALVPEQLPAATPAVVVKEAVVPQTVVPEAKPKPSAVTAASRVRPPSGLEVLDSLFATTPDLTLATEEIYLQGLQGEAEKNDSDQQQWLTFNLGKEQYALDITFVREIIKPREITDIPRVPDFILGVISLRGVIVPIYDLCRRLKLGQVTTDNRSRIVVCEHGDRIAGLLVDNITQVVRFSTGEIEPPPAILSGLDRELVEGVGRVQGKMIILLDLPSVLDIELK